MVWVLGVLVTVLFVLAVWYAYLAAYYYDTAKFQKLSTESEQRLRAHWERETHAARAKLAEIRNVLNGGEK